MPDTAQSEAPEIEALTNTLRACLVRAYDAGKRDGVAALAAVATSYELPASRLGSERLIRIEDAVKTVLSRGAPVRAGDIAKEFGLRTDSVRVCLSTMIRAGAAVRTTYGLYAPAPSAALGG